MVPWWHAISSSSDHPGMPYTRGGHVPAFIRTRVTRIPSCGSRDDMGTFRRHRRDSSLSFPSHTSFYSCSRFSTAHWNVLFLRLTLHTLMNKASSSESSLCSSLRWTVPYCNSPFLQPHLLLSPFCDTSNPRMGMHVTACRLDDARAFHTCAF